MQYLCIKQSWWESHQENCSFLLFTQHPLLPLLLQPHHLHLHPQTLHSLHLSPLLSVSNPTSITERLQKQEEEKKDPYKKTIRFAKTKIDPFQEMENLRCPTNHQIGSGEKLTLGPLGPPRHRGVLVVLQSAQLLDPLVPESGPETESGFSRGIGSIDLGSCDRRSVSLKQKGRRRRRKRWGWSQVLTLALERSI